MVTADLRRFRIARSFFSVMVLPQGRTCLAAVWVGKFDKSGIGSML